MIRLFDLLVIFVVAILVFTLQPALGVLLLLVNFIFITQYWKTVLLTGDDVKPVVSFKRLKAATLAGVFTAVVYFALESDSLAGGPDATTELWNGELFPLVIALILFSAVLMVTLITEKRKR
jgi:hypothetical protein